MTRLHETKKDAIKCLERLLKQFDKKYDRDVASEFIDAVCSISKQNLMTKKEIDVYRDEYISIFEKYKKQ